MATQNEIADAGKSLETDNSGGIRTAEQEAIERITLKPAPASVLLGHSGEGMKPLRGAEFPLDGLEPVVGAEQFMKDVGINGSLLAEVRVPSTDDMEDMILGVVDCQSSFSEARGGYAVLGGISPNRYQLVQLRKTEDEKGGVKYMSFGEVERTYARGTDNEQTTTVPMPVKGIPNNGGIMLSYGDKGLADAGFKIPKLESDATIPAIIMISEGKLVVEQPMADLEMSITTGGGSETLVLEDGSSGGYVPRNALSNINLAEARDDIVEAFVEEEGVISDEPGSTEAPLEEDPAVSAAQRIIEDQIAEVQAGEGKTIEVELPKVEAIPTAESKDKTPEEQHLEEVKAAFAAALLSPEGIVKALEDRETPVSKEVAKHLKDAIEAFRDYDVAIASEEAWKNFVVGRVEQIMPKIEAELNQSQELINSIGDFPVIFHKFAQAIEHDITEAADINRRYGVWNRGQKVVDDLDQLSRSESARVLVETEGVNDETRSLIDRVKQNKYSSVDQGTASNFIDAVRELGLGTDREAITAGLRDAAAKSPNWKMKKDAVLETAEIIDRGSVVKADIKERARKAGTDLREYMEWRNQGGMIRHDINEMHRIAQTLESLKGEFDWASNYAKRAKELLAQAA